MSQPRANVAGEFVKLRMSGHYKKMALCNAIVIVGFNLVSLLFERMAAVPANLPTLRLVHAGVIALALLSRLLRHLPAWIQGLFMQGVQAAYVGGMGLFVHRMVAAGQADLLVVPSSNMLAVMIFLVMATPGTMRAAGASALAYLAIAAAAIEPGFGLYYKYLVVVAVSLAAALTFHARLTAEIMRRAQEEILGRLNMAPIDLVRRTISASEGEIEAMLRPRRLPCVCLASDWRGYQALSRRITPEALAAALEHYYGMCQRLLAEVFPDGCYVSDWSADELLVVFFLSDPAPVLVFAQRLLAAKADFVRDQSLNIAIDVGVAAGESMVGIFGPRTNRKMMAIGEVAVTARRLQTMGKTFRSELGEADRVIYADASGEVLHLSA